MNESLLEDYLIRKRGDKDLPENCKKESLGINTINLMKNSRSVLDIDIDKALKTLKAIEKEETRKFLPQILSAIYQGLMHVDD